VLHAHFPKASLLRLQSSTHCLLQRWRRYCCCCGRTFRSIKQQLGKAASAAVHCLLLLLLVGML
jgi:hypothetical protein